MAEQNQEPVECVEEDEDDHPGYKPPEQKSINEIQNLDADDESLRKYKETLLGPFKGSESQNTEVTLEKMIFCPEGRSEIELDLSGDIKEVSKKTFCVKEGTQYRLKVFFTVKNNIVSGLKIKQKIGKLGIKVPGKKFMLGSFGPKDITQEAKTGIEELPSGVFARGACTIKNELTDDYDNTYCKWEFKLDIKKEWEN